MTSINDCYSPHTGEHIATNDPADWVGRAGTPAPVYDAQTQGCFWRDSAWVVEDVVPEPTPVPEMVSRAQGKAALIQADLWAGVLSFVESIADPKTKALAEVALNDTTDWRRDSPFLNEAAAALGLLPGDLDGLFIVAAGIQL